MNEQETQAVRNVLAARLSSRLLKEVVQKVINATLLSQINASTRTTVESATIDSGPVAQNAPLPKLFCRTLVLLTLLNSVSTRRWPEAKWSFR